MESEQLANRIRIIEMTYEAGATHLGSALSSVDIIEAIYSIKKPEEKFVLSNGHAASALYAVMERYGTIKTTKLDELGFHPERNPDLGIEVSTGSLGQGLPIAVGMALADRNKNVYCSVSDGECAEGSVWEAIRLIAKEGLTNLKLVVNANAYGGYGEIDIEKLAMSLSSFGLNLIEVDGHDLEAIKSALRLKALKPVIVFAHTTSNQLPFLQGLSAHYYQMKPEDYELALKIWLKS